MKKIISLLLVLLLALTSAVAVNAEGIKDIFGAQETRGAIPAGGVSGTWGDLTWSLTDAGALTIRPTVSGSTADMNMPYYEDAWRVYTPDIVSVTIENGVTSIANYAFSECNLTSVTIPGCVTSIGDRAFATCDNLESVTIQNGVTSIGEEAFCECDLTSVTVPASVTLIGRYAFRWNSNFESITILNGSSNMTLGDSIVESGATIYCYENSAVDNWANNSYNSTWNEYVVAYIGSDYAITFDANGGSGAPAAIDKTAGTAIVLPNTIPTYVDHIFAGWSLDRYAATPTYLPGDTYSREGDVTLYAVWVWNGDSSGIELKTTLYDWNTHSNFKSTYLPDMSMNIDEDGKPAGLDTAWNNQVSPNWDAEIKKIWSETNRYDEAINSFLQLDPVTGYHSFDSAKQMATYNRHNHEFTIYNDYGGQFLPIGDYYFGIQMSGEFTMPKNGKVQWQGKTGDMKYEFNGDDLIYVYIDGVKVLNGGSSHGNVKTSINFATGEIATVCEGWHDNSGTATYTTLRDQYEAAYREAHNMGNGAHGDGLSDYLSDYFELKNGNYVFKENSEHTFEMFYAETGAGDSNCKVKLNLVLEPQDDNTTYSLTYNSGNKTFTNSTLAHGAGEVTSKLHDDTYAYGATETVAGDTGVYAMNEGTSTFLGWGLEANSTQVDYPAGSTIHIYQDTTLYAKFNDTTVTAPPGGYIYYWDGDTLLQTEELNDRETYTIAENPITDLDAYADVELDDRLLPIKSGYVWGGWYKINQTPGTTSVAQAFNRTITINSSVLDANGNLNLYAGWVPIGNVTADNSDPNKNSYITSTLSGFNLEGIQIKSKDIADEGVDRAEWQNAQYDGLRFLTVYSNTLISNLEGLYASGNANYVAASDTDVKYGYTMYAKADIANLQTLKAGTTGAVDIDCTRDTNLNHKYFTNYRLSTIVIKYEGTDQQYKGTLIEARAYADYIDANGFARREYNTYVRPDTSMFAGGCRATFNQAAQALARQ